MYLDCHVEWLPEAEFQTQLKKLLDDPERVADYTEKALNKLKE